MEMAKVPKDHTMVFKVRVAASVVETLSILSEKNNEVTKVREKTMMQKTGKLSCWQHLPLFNKSKSPTLK